jgi:hypothetical protein
MQPHLPVRMKPRSAHKPQAGEKRITAATRKRWPRCTPKTQCYFHRAYAVTVKGAVVETGKYLSVSRKKDGKWLYIRDTWNSNTPPAVK